VTAFYGKKIGVISQEPESNKSREEVPQCYVVQFRSPGFFGLAAMWNKPAVTPANTACVIQVPLITPTFGQVGLPDPKPPHSTPEPPVTELDLHQPSYHLQEHRNFPTNDLLYVHDHNQKPHQIPNRSM
jgi:hypothetical protein